MSSKFENDQRFSKSSVVDSLNLTSAGAHIRKTVSHTMSSWSSCLNGEDTHVVSYTGQTSS
jgi:hypothetical protein